MSDPTKARSLALADRRLVELAGTDIEWTMNCLLALAPIVGDSRSLSKPLFFGVVRRCCYLDYSEN